jgi:putative endopeptidase
MIAVRPISILRLVLGLGVGMIALRCAAAEPVPPRFSTNHMDLAASPKADFSRFAFGAWLQRSSIPADKSRWGAFDELAEYNWAAVRRTLETTAATHHPKGSVEQKVADFYRSALDTNAINRAGLRPIRSDLKRIEGIRTSGDLARVVAHLHNQGVGGVFTVYVSADRRHSTVNALYASQGGLSLPSRSYYFDDAFESVRHEFTNHVARLLTLAGDKPAKAGASAATIFELQKRLAATSRTPVELRDQLANYNKMAVSDLASKFPAFPLAVYLEARGITNATEVIVGQPEFFAGLQTQLSEQPLSAWKTYLRYQLINDAAPFLASPFEAENFRFYSTVLRGTPAMEPRWQRAARAVDSGIGEALGQLYVQRYYPREAEARMRQMITNIQIVMRERLQKLDWMSETTRQKALAKFDRFVPRIGHPEKWRDYSTVEIKPGDYFGNVRAATVFEIRRNVNKLGRPVDKSEWGMTPPTVNAYFQGTANQIVFPAGILQPPFFDFTLDDAVNYGAIGAVIGHEITHGFDDQGSRYDAEGNLNNWWSAEDRERFEQRAAKLITQYNGYTALPGLNVNGKLSLGENIADLGGVSIAFEALQRSLVGQPRARIDGFTPEQRFFIAWAQQWRTNYREDAMKRQVTVGPHAPGMFRAVGPLSNLPEFYQAFEIQPGDPMWRNPEDRTKIW